MKVFKKDKKIVLTNNNNKILTELNTSEAKKLVEKLVTVIEEEN